MTERNEKEPTQDSKYIQQHLANERTILAWVRTSIAITGIGFLVTNMHARSSLSHLSNITILVIGVLSVVTGVLTIVLATVSYFRKIKQINEQTFLSEKMLIMFLAILMTIIITIFGIYFLVV